MIFHENRHELSSFVLKKQNISNGVYCSVIGVKGYDLSCHVDFRLRWGLTKHQPLWVILCRLPEKGRKEIEEIVEEMKERDREEKETGMKVKNQKK